MSDDRSPELLLRTSRFSVERVERVSPDGTKRAREVVRHPGAVAIVPRLADGRVCLIRNYRVSVADTLIEIPAGTLEPGEPPEQCAARELTEETGYVAGRLTRLASFFLSPGILDERMHLFLAEQLTAGPAAREPGEEIQNLLTPWSDALAMIASGAIQDAKTIAGLLLVEQIRQGPERG